MCAAMNAHIHTHMHAYRTCTYVHTTWNASISFGCSKGTLEGDLIKPARNARRPVPLAGHHWLHNAESCLQSPEVASRWCSCATFIFSCCFTVVATMVVPLFQAILLDCSWQKHRHYGELASFEPDTVLPPGSCYTHKKPSEVGAVYSSRWRTGCWMSLARGRVQTRVQCGP